MTSCLLGFQTAALRRPHLATCGLIVGLGLVLFGCKTSRGSAALAGAAGSRGLMDIPDVPIVVKVNTPQYELKLIVTPADSISPEKLPANLTIEKVAKSAAQTPNNRRFVVTEKFFRADGYALFGKPVNWSQVPGVEQVNLAQIGKSLGEMVESLEVFNRPDTNVVLQPLQEVSTLIEHAVADKTAIDPLKMAELSRIIGDRLDSSMERSFFAAYYQYQDDSYDKEIRASEAATDAADDSSDRSADGADDKRSGTQGDVHRMR